MKLSVFIGGGMGVRVWIEERHGFKLLPAERAMLFSDRYVHRHWHLPFGWLFVVVRPGEEGTNRYRQCTECRRLHG